MTALDEAIAAVRSHQFPWLRVSSRRSSDDRRIASVIAAIPDRVLVDLLVERGVLEPVTLAVGNHTLAVYQRKDT